MPLLLDFVSFDHKFQNLRACTIYLILNIINIQNIIEIRAPHSKSFDPYIVGLDIAISLMEKV